MNGAEHEGLLTIFLAEAEELLHQLHEQLAELRYGVDGQRLLDDLHRSFYTLQGGAAVMKLSPIADLAGRCEMVIERLRRRRLPITPRVFSLLEAAARELEAMVQTLVRGDAINIDTQSLQQQLLESIQEGRSRVPEASNEGGGVDPLEQFFESPLADSGKAGAGPQPPGHGAPGVDPLLEPNVPAGGALATPRHTSAADLRAADVGATEKVAWQPLKPTVSGAIKPLPALSTALDPGSPPTVWRQLADAVVQAHRQGDHEAMDLAVQALADWLDRH